MNPINKLKDRVLKGKSKGSDLTGILDLVREFGCLSEVIGREFEVKDSTGKVVYNIKQKPMAIKQLNVLLEELHTLKRLDNEREAAKWGKK